MSRGGASVFLVAWLAFSFGCTRGQPALPERAKAARLDLNEDRLAAAIMDSLPEKPRSVKVNVDDLGKPTTPPVKLVTADVFYEKLKGLPYGEVSFHTVHRVGDDTTPRTTVTVLQAKGSEQHKLASVAFDPEGNKHLTTPAGEKAAEKLAALEQRCAEIKDALRKAIPQEPAAGQ